MGKYTSKEQFMYLRIRNVCGLLGVILPWLALFSAGIAPHPSNEWWWSISCTYYQSPVLVGVLVPAAIVLIAYVAYDIWDSIVTTLSGIFGLCIVLFPCNVSWIENGTPVGFFQVPIEISHIIHSVSAALFFITIALNSLLLFTKSGGEMTDRKKIRNKIYRICGIGMLAGEVVFAIVMLCGAPKWSVMVIEIILLHFFGLSWLVKGEFFPFLNDKKEDQKPEGFIKLATDRYSVRSFSPAPVEDEKIEKILEAAKVAPTAVNFQPQMLYVVKTGEAIEKLANIRPLFGAPAAVIVCYDEKLSWKNSRDSAHDSGEVDAAIVCTHMMLEAWELGIGSCWIGAFSPAEVSEAFNIPANIHPVAILPLGYPSDDSKPSERHLSYRATEDWISCV